MRSLFVAMALLLIATAPASATSGNHQRLNSAQIRDTLVGRSFTYPPTPGMISEAGPINNFCRSGKWFTSGGRVQVWRRYTISNGALCFHARGESRCVGVGKGTDGSLYLIGLGRLPPSAPQRETRVILNTQPIHPC